MQNSEYQLRRFATVLNDSNDAITVQDLFGNILAWNKGAEKMYGYSKEDALQMNITMIVPEDLKSNALSYISRIKEGEIVESHETKRVSKNGIVLDVWLTITCLRNDQGNIDALATTERDVTPLKREIEQLRGMLPICANCKNIRDEKGYWQKIEKYITDHSEAIFTHGLCPKCIKKLYPKLASKILEK